MQKLKLKKEFIGITTTKKCYALGEVTFNTLTTPENAYPNYFKLDAFTSMFEYVEVCDKCNEEKCICKPAKSEDKVDDKLTQVNKEVKKYTGVRQNKKNVK